MDLKEIAKTMSCDEFIKEFNCNDLCPSAYGLKNSRDIVCRNIECDNCWKNALMKVGFK